MLLIKGSSYAKLIRIYGGFCIFLPIVLAMVSQNFLVLAKNFQVSRWAYEDPE